MSPQPTESVGEKAPTIRRGRVDSLTIYEITDHELDVLAAGSPSSIYLNFSVALLSVFASSVLALVTATFISTATQTVAILLAIVCGIAGLLLLVLWKRSHRSIAGIVKRIQDRCPQSEESVPPGAGNA